MVNDSTKNTSYFFLLDKKGIVCGLSDGTDETFGLCNGVSWKELWPTETLSDGVTFTFEQEDILWQAEIKEIKDEPGQIIKYLATYKYATEAKKKWNENQISRLEQKVQFYEAIISNSNDEIFVTDGHGKVILANPASENNYGVSASNMVGKSVWELEERGAFFPAVTPLVMKEKKKITINQETATGNKLMVTATPVFDNNGAIDIIICNSRDVTSLEDMRKSYQDMKNKVQHNNSSKANRVKEAENNRLIYSENSSLAELMKMLQRIAKTESTVLLEGNTGTGKDLFAKKIHDLSNRKEKNFLKVNCAALPQELIESELFGYKSGAFTGASYKGKVGQFTLANQGTIFLDEIAEIPMTLQPKLLQVIEEQKFTPIGSKSVENVDVRIIAATNRDLKEMVKNNTFRGDLYYRLCVLSVIIPSLEDRKEDIPLLLDYYLNMFCKKHNRRTEISQNAIRYLVAYDWPGNVRELKHLIEQLIVTANSNQIKLEHLPPHITSMSNTIDMIKKFPGDQTLQAYIETIESELIVNSYQKLKSSYKVARELGISQSSAIRKIRKYVK